MTNPLTEDVMVDDLATMAAANPLAADTRPPVYREGDFWVVRASAFGWCDTALLYASQGVEAEQPSEAMRRAWAFGAAKEREVIEAVEEEGWRALTVKELRADGRKVDRRNGQVAGELILGGLKIRCHPDAIVERQGDGEQKVLEAKTLAKGSDLLSKSTYLWQFAVEKAVTGLDLLVAVGWKVDGEDEETGDSGKVIERVELFDGIDTPSKVQVKVRAAKLLQLFEGGNENISSCSGVMFPCPYFPLHDEKVQEEAEVLEGEVADQVAALLGEREELSETRKKTENRLKALNKELDALVEPGDEEDRRRVQVGDLIYETWKQEILEQTMTRKAHSKTYRTITKVDE